MVDPTLGWTCLEKFSLQAKFSKIHGRLILAERGGYDFPVSPTDFHGKFGSTGCFKNHLEFQFNILAKYCLWNYLFNKLNIKKVFYDPYPLKHHKKPFDCLFVWLSQYFRKFPEQAVFSCNQVQVEGKKCRYNCKNRTVSARYPIMIFHVLKEILVFLYFTIFLLCFKKLLKIIFFIKAPVNTCKYICYGVRKSQYSSTFINVFWMSRGNAQLLGWG